MKTQLLDKYVSYTLKGHVTAFKGLVVRASGLRIPVGSLCRIRSSNSFKLAEVVSVDSSEISLMCIEDTYGIMVGDEVELLSTFQYVPVGSGMLGRVVDSFGKVLDGGDQFQIDDSYPLFSAASNPMKRQVIREILTTGIKSIDAFITCGKGQRIGIFSGSGVGKSVLMGMITRYTGAEIVVVCLVGERGREVREFIENSLGEEGMKRAVVVVETSDRPAVCRYRAPFAATSIAEYFRDKGKDVLLLMDSITRMANAKREVGLSVGEMPTTKGYTPSVFADMPRLLERAGNFDTGTITGIYTVLVEQDDINDPIGDHARSILDGHIWLSRGLANMGIYPACDILQSVSRLMINVVDREHYKAAKTLLGALSVYEENKDFVNVGAYKPGTNKELDAAIKIKNRLYDFLSQDPGESSNFDDVKSKLLELCVYYKSLL